jgi:hypothetical protein
VWNASNARQLLGVEHAAPVLKFCLESTAEYGGEGGGGEKGGEDTSSLESSMPLRLTSKSWNASAICSRSESVSTASALILHRRPQTPTRLARTAALRAKQAGSPCAPTCRRIVDIPQYT